MAADAAEGKGNAGERLGGWPFPRGDDFHRGLVTTMFYNMSKSFSAGWLKKVRPFKKGLKYLKVLETGQ